MKGKLLRPYEVDMTHTICAGEELEIVGGYCTCDGYSYTCIMPNGTQRVINADYLEITDYTPYIDWERVRIKAAIAAMQGIYASPLLVIPMDDIAKISVEQADALIKELKKRNVNECKLSCDTNPNREAIGSEICEFERNPIIGYTCQHCGRKYDIKDSDSNNPEKFCCLACEYRY